MSLRSEAADRRQAAKASSVSAWAVPAMVNDTRTTASATAAHRGILKESSLPRAFPQFRRQGDEVLFATGPFPIHGIVSDKEGYTQCRVA